MNNLFNIKDNITVITGGTGVLGRAIAKYLAENGAKVIIVGRNEEVGKKIIDEIHQSGYDAEEVYQNRCIHETYKGGE